MAAELLAQQARRVAAGGIAFARRQRRRAPLRDRVPVRGDRGPARRGARDQGRHGAAGGMDRLLCGDVGFGKTEVAMRAAFKAVAGGFQVAVLAPTTLLAEQHLESFSERFAGSGSGSPASTASAPRRAQQGARARRPGASSTSGRHPRAAHRQIGVQEPRPAGDRRGAPLRGEAEGAAEGGEAAAPRLRTASTCSRCRRRRSRAPCTSRSSACATSACSPRRRRRAWRSRPGSARGRTAWSRARSTRELERGGQVFFVHSRVQDIETIAAKLAHLVPAMKLDVESTASCTRTASPTRWRPTSTGAPSAW